MTEKEKEEKTPNIKIECEKKTVDKIFNRAMPFIEELPLEIKKEGWHTRIVDNSHVALYEGFISKKLFEQYDVNVDTKIGIDLNRINIPLSLAKEKITISYDGGSRVKIDNYKHTLIDMAGMPEPKMPDLKPTVELKTDETEHIKKIIRVASKISDHFAIITEKNKDVWLHVEGDTDELKEPIGKAKILQEPDKYPVRALYSVDFINNVFKDLSEEIIIRYSEDNPIFVIEEKKDEKHVFLVAPRIESE
jgi:proliferating cell nuclear antigen